jgi:protein SCO1/2
MKQRIGLSLIIALAGLVLIGAMALFVLNPERSSTDAIGGAFTLTDQRGARVTEAALKGQPSLVFFGFTHCPDVCKALGPKGDGLKTFFITVDPERDRPETLKAYLESFDPRIIGLTGSREEVDIATRAYRAFARKVPLDGGGYVMDHTALVYLMDKKGRFVSSMNFERPPEENAKRIADLF